MMQGCAYHHEHRRARSPLRMLFPWSKRGLGCVAMKLYCHILGKSHNMIASAVWSWFAAYNVVQMCCPDVLSRCAVMVT